MLHLKTSLALTLICQYTEQVAWLRYFGFVFYVCFNIQSLLEACLLSKVT